MTFSLPFPLSTLTPLWLRAEGWDRFPGLVHGFSGRVPKNAAEFSQAQGGDLTVCTVKQVHGDEIIMVNQHCKAWEKRPEADGMITAEAGLLLGIASAECVPVLMVAPQQGIVAALHAGWRGTLKGISARAIEMFTAAGNIDPTSLWVALGPAIGGCCYEVGIEIGESLVQRWHPSSLTAWRPHGEKGLLDLREINLAQCEQAGVPRERMQLVGPCTFCDSSRFASYRREGPSASRQLSMIGWQTEPSEPR
ncbi:MAG: peptidoglycan editing factor PgeF [Deltaproteobacteria bacterium]|nr:peptidoglycan editing factor PgeF [Deltaproteobacteria bacterium]